MNQTISSRVNVPAVATDTSVRTDATQRSRSKPASDSDATDANSTFEKRVAEAGRANAQLSPAVAGRYANGDSEKDKQDNDGAKAPEDDVSDASQRLAPNDAANPMTVAQWGQVQWGFIPLRTDAGTGSISNGLASTNVTLPGAQIYSLGEKSASALLAARDHVKSQDSVDDAIAKPQTTSETAISVDANATHWIFAAPVTPKQNELPDASINDALKGAVATIVRSGDNQGDTTTTEPQRTNVTASTKQNVELPQQSVAAVSTPQDASSDQPRDRQAKGDPASKSFEKLAAPSNVAVQSADAATFSEDARSTTGTNVVQQVRSVIVDALRNDTVASPASAPAPVAVAPDRPAMAGQMLRTLDLTLEPPDLGAVKLRLSLKANTLAIDAETSKAATAKLLNDDRYKLEKSLRTAGYDVSAIRVMDASGASGAMLGSGSSFQDGNQPRAATRDPSDMQRKAGDNRQQDDRPSPDQQQSRSSSHPAPARQGSAVYI